MDRVKRIWYLLPMRAAKVQASLRIRAVSPEPSLLAHTSSESRGTFRQKARSLAPLNGWACAVKICHDGMLEDTNSLDGAHIQIACVSWVVSYVYGRCMSLFVFASSWCNWKAMIYVCSSFCASSLLYCHSVTLCVLSITAKQATEYVWPCFIRIHEAILGLCGSRGQMGMMEAKLCLFGHQATKVS